MFVCVTAWKFKFSKIGLSFLQQKQQYDNSYIFIYFRIKIYNKITIIKSKKKKEKKI